MKHMSHTPVSVSVYNVSGLRCNIESDVGVYPLTGPIQSEHKGKTGMWSGKFYLSPFNSGFPLSSVYGNRYLESYHK